MVDIGLYKLCYNQNNQNKSDIDSFIADSNRKIIKKGCFLASTNKIGSNARRTMEGNEEKPIIQYLLKDFEDMFFLSTNVDDSSKVGKNKDYREQRIPASSYQRCY